MPSGSGAESPDRDRHDSTFWLPWLAVCAPGCEGTQVHAFICRARGRRRLLVDPVTDAPQSVGIHPRNALLGSLRLGRLWSLPPSWHEDETHVFAVGMLLAVGLLIVIWRGPKNATLTHTSFGPTTIRIGDH